MTCVAWCVHFPEVLSPPCLPLSPFLFLCVGWCVHLPDVLSPLSPLSPSLSSFLSPSLSPNLSFFLFPFVVGGLILHFFKQRTVGVGFFKVSALVLDGVSAFPRSCLLYCLPLYPFFLVSLCLPLPIVPLLVSFCWMVRLPFGGSCLPVPPIVPLLDSPCWKVCSPCRLFPFVGHSRGCFPLYIPLVVSLWGWRVRLSDGLVSHCTPSCFPLLDGASAFLRVFPFAEGLVSFCLCLYPFLFPFVGWCVRLPKHLAPLLSTLSPFLSSKQCAALGVLNAFLRCSPWSCLPLSPTQCLPSCFLFVGWRVRRPGTLSPLFPRCLVPTCVPVLDDVFAFSMSCLSLVSQCFPLSSRMCVCVGWCVRLPDVLSLIVSPHVCLCWMACPPSQGLVSPSHPFCPIERIVSHCLPTRLPVLDGGSAFPTCCLPFLSPIVSPHVCL